MTTPARGIFIGACLLVLGTIGGTVFYRQNIYASPGEVASVVRDLNTARENLLATENRSQDPGMALFEEEGMAYSFQYNDGSRYPGMHTLNLMGCTINGRVYSGTVFFNVQEFKDGFITGDLKVNGGAVRNIGYKKARFKEDQAFGECSVNGFYYKLPDEQF